MVTRQTALWANHLKGVGGHFQQSDLEAVLGEKKGWGGQEQPLRKTLPAGEHHHHHHHCSRHHHHHHQHHSHHPPHQQEVDKNNHSGRHYQLASTTTRQDWLRSRPMGGLVVLAPWEFCFYWTLFRISDAHSVSSKEHWPGGSNVDSISGIFLLASSCN